MLYALSVGMGQDPPDARELPFVYEGAGLQAVPTMAVVLASTGIIRKPGVDFTKILHGEQRLVLYRQFAAELPANSRVSAVYDNGAGKGAVVLDNGRCLLGDRREVRPAACGAPLNRQAIPSPQSHRNGSRTRQRLPKRLDRCRGPAII